MAVPSPTPATLHLFINLLGVPSFFSYPTNNFTSAWLFSLRCWRINTPSASMFKIFTSLLPSGTIPSSNTLLVISSASFLAFSPDCFTSFHTVMVLTPGTRYSNNLAALRNGISTPISNIILLKRGLTLLDVAKPRVSSNKNRFCPVDMSL